MKQIFCLAFVAAFALAGCGKPDEQKETAQQVKQVYDVAAARTKPIAVGNAEAGKVIAKKCARCHGMDGTLASLGAPFIAGLDQDYMVSAMLAYTDGSRKNELMKPLIAELKPDQIANVSAYYAALKTSWKGADVGNKSIQPMISLSQDAVDAGSALASRCNSCHGENGSTSRNNLVPLLAAMPPEYFIPSLKSYFNDKRKHDWMKIFGSSISGKEIKQLAAYYAVQPPIKLPRPGKSKGNAQAGEHAAGLCAGCHSIDGNSLNPEIPSLAGQPAEYLIKAMKDYREGRRNDPLMSDAIHLIKDETILNLAAYYSNQKLESPQHRAIQRSAAFDPVAEGRRIAGSCDGCHGNNGNSEKPGIPSLTGLHVKYLVSATRAYRDGIRKHGVMKKMVGHLSDTDIEKVGFYYATQTPISGKHAPNADLVAGKKISSGCTSCHGEGGVSTAPTTPSLAGQDAGYLAEATRNYASGARNNETMAGPAKGLKPDDITNVAAYFASLKAAKPDTTLPVSPQLSIVQKCNRCHGEKGRSTEPGIPSLAGQSEAYLVLAIKEYQDGTRKNNFMNAMSDVLSLVEMKAIAAYYAQQ